MKVLPTFIDAAMGAIKKRPVRDMAIKSGVAHVNKDAMSILRFNVFLSDLTAVLTRVVPILLCSGRTTMQVKDIAAAYEALNKEAPLFLADFLSKKKTKAIADKTLATGKKLKVCKMATSHTSPRGKQLIHK